ncbi:hypothetical protein [Gracilibacillus sp. JCM 18860]|uniref:hypothetical protein n=1 Tax=Gracilibacillus sp. JCM 18860 TaxID=1306159 RepID=UPI000AE0995B
MSRIHPIEYCEVGGTKGRFEIDNVFERLLFFPHNRDEILMEHNSIFSDIGSFHDTFLYRFADFIQQVKKGVPPAEMNASSHDALAVQEVIEAAIQSQKNGGEVVDISNVQGKSNV